SRAWQHRAHPRAPARVSACDARTTVGPSAYSSSVRPGLQRRQSHGGIERMEHDDNDMVDEATAVRRQLAAPCRARRHAHTHGVSLAAMSFVSDEGEMLVFGVEGLDIGDVLEAAAGRQWERTPDQPLRGN